jgi:hypothetical protein
LDGLTPVSSEDYPFNHYDLSGGFERKVVITPKYPHESSVITRVIFSDIIDVTYNLVEVTVSLIVNGTVTRTEEHLVSLTKGMLNENGVSIDPIEVINRDSELIEITDFGDLEMMEDGMDWSINLKDSSFDLTSPVAASTALTPAELLTTALSKLNDFDLYHIPLMFDGGVVNPAFQKALALLASSKMSLEVLSPPDSKYVTALVNYKKSLAVDNMTECIMPVGYNVDTTVIPNVKVKVPASVEYLRTLAQNAKGNYEFAPIFGSKTGIVSANNFTHYFGPADRNTLQKAQLNPIVKDEVKGLSYFANNLTTTVISSDLQEENVRRFVNKLRFDVDRLLDQFLSDPWDLSVVENINDAVANYFTNTVGRMGRKPYSKYELDVTLPANKKVSVKFGIYTQGSIKYIDVLYRILSFA